VSSVTRQFDIPVTNMLVWAASYLKTQSEISRRAPSGFLACVAIPMKKYLEEQVNASF